MLQDRNLENYNGAQVSCAKCQASYWQSVNKSWMRKEWRWRTRTTPGSESTTTSSGNQYRRRYRTVDWDVTLSWPSEKGKDQLMRGTFHENKGGLPYWTTASLLAQRIKNLSPVQETQGFPGWGRSPGERNSNPFQYSCPGKIPWTEEPRGLQSVGSQRVRHDWVTNTFLAQCCLQFQGQDMPVNNKK